MATQLKPTTLTEVRYAEFVQHTNDLGKVDTMARRFFREFFDSSLSVTARLLFTEDGQRVYECYQDSGSEDYLYIVVTKSDRR
jgi:hypothetical protein